MKPDPNRPTLDDVAGLFKALAGVVFWGLVVVVLWATCVAPH